MPCKLLEWSGCWCDGERLIWPVCHAAAGASAAAAAAAARCIMVCYQGHKQDLADGTCLPTTRHKDSPMQCADTHTCLPCCCHKPFLCVGRTCSVRSGRHAGQRKESRTCATDKQGAHGAHHGGKPLLQLCFGAAAEQDNLIARLCCERAQHLQRQQHKASGVLGLWHTSMEGMLLASGYDSSTHTHVSSLKHV